MVPFDGSLAWGNYFQDPFSSAVEKWFFGLSFWSWVQKKYQALWQEIRVNAVPSWNAKIKRNMIHHITLPWWGSVHTEKQCFSEVREHEACLELCANLLHHAFSFKQELLQLLLLLLLDQPEVLLLMLKQTQWKYCVCGPKFVPNDEPGGSAVGAMQKKIIHFNNN